MRSECTHIIQHRVLVLHCLYMKLRLTPSFSCHSLSRFALHHQVDVSGFTRLSEAFAQLGTEGCEEFSLIMSNFFARMCATIEAHGGDVDCFAGDALLIIFPVSSSSENDDIAIADDGSAAPTLGAAVGSAVKCAIAICQALNGYSPSESHPSLGIHCALSAGTVFAVECGESLCIYLPLMMSDSGFIS